MKECCVENKQLDTLVNALKESGLSATLTKKRLLSLFSMSKKPLSYIDVSNKIKDVNESTIFRNLKQLTEAGILSEIELGEGFKRYELKPSNHHHHHIKCVKCGKIDSIDKCNLKVFEKQLLSLGYSNITHQIKFSGTCQNC